MRTLRSVVIEICNRPDGMDILHPAIQACKSIEAQRLANSTGAKTAVDGTHEEKQVHRTKENGANKKRPAKDDHDSNSVPSKCPRTISETYPKTEWKWIPEKHLLDSLGKDGTSFYPRCCEIHEISEKKKRCRYHPGTLRFRYNLKHKL